MSDRASAQSWIEDLLKHGPIRNDMVIFVHAWGAATDGDGARLERIAELGAASQTGRERWLEAVSQGSAFRRIARDATGASEYARLLGAIEDDALVYPVAAATLFACHGIPRQAAATAFLHGVVANLVSAAQRLVPLGQTDAQCILRDLRGTVLAAAREACALPDDVDPFEAMGSSALVAELGCMAHETQYTRLFRT